MEYCDYIAHLISTELPFIDMKKDDIIYEVGKPRLHLSSNGVFLSTKKIITVTDMYKKQYRITVEAL
jgi:hypothetical protein